MCGFAGFIGHHGLKNQLSRHVAWKMGEAIKHRGPDDGAVWEDTVAQFTGVHRRLAVRDLSPAGQQPMASPSGRYIIFFNGEIYNHILLRKDIEAGHGPQRWRGHSDTETLLACIEAWGFRPTLERCIGMFAIALWDQHERMLHLARDRFGEKPLYYGENGGTFFFCSELKSLKAHPSFNPQINRHAIALQLRYNYIPSPYTIFEGLHKLEAGHVLSLKAHKGRVSDTTVSTPFWALTEAIEAAKAQPYRGSEEEAIHELDSLLRNAVAMQLEADVPLGAFLSGGIDSTLIVSLMQAYSAKPVHTFTIGFHEDGYDEAIQAKAVARHLGTNHTELYISPQEAMDVIPRLSSMYDEPFSDSSQIPTFLVSRLTRQYVTVALSGDAGDEMFGGYTRYFGTQKWWRRIQTIPQPWRTLASKGLMAPSPHTWNQFGLLLAKIRPDDTRLHDFGNGVRKLAGVLSVKDECRLYQHFVSHWGDPAQIVIGAEEPPTKITHPSLKLPSLVEQMMALDTLTYLPDDILVKVDRAAMANSLETRVPFLDHRIAELSWRLPMNLKVRDGKGKWILKQILKKYVPHELMDRPKKGFGIPLHTWLRGPLRDWAEDLLDEHRLRAEGYFEPRPIRALWESHLSGRRNWQYHVWDILMFQAWLQEQ